MPVVAFEILSATASHAARKPAAHADREGSTPFADMLDTPAKKPAAKDARDTRSAGNEPASAAQSDAVQNKAGKDDKAATSDPKTKTAKTSDATEPAVAAAQPADDATTDTASKDQDDTAAAGDFLAAVADVTGMPVAPVDASKTEAKSDDDKSDDAKTDVKTDDKADASTAATGTAAAPDAATPVTPDTKSIPVAAAITAPAEPAAAADAAPAAAAPAAATAPAAVAEQSLAKVIAAAGIVETTDAKGDGKADAKTEAKTEAKTDAKSDGKSEAKPDKLQAAANLDTPPLLTQSTAGGKQAASAQMAQPQQGQPAQAQGQKPAADAAAQAPKPAADHQDAPAPDVAAVAKPVDATQPMPLLQANGLTAPQASDQTPATPAPAATPQAVALPIQGIAVEIAGKALAGKNRFDIRLDPPELGKIHVRLDVDHKGEVTSIITADRSDTFDLLRRDAQSLERALNDAGVKTSSNGLQFSLRDHGQQNMQPQFADSARVVVRDDTLDTEIIAPVYRPLSGNRAGLDIRV